MAIRDINDAQNPYRIGKTEAIEILISSVVLAIAFSFVLRRTKISNYFVYNFGNTQYLVMLGMMFVIILLSFVGHELGHKFVAQSYGFWSEYRMYPFGLLLSLFFGYIGFLIAMPGAVMIRGNYITLEQNGKIGAAGPLVNIVLALIGTIGVLLLNHTYFMVPFYLLMVLNGALALFNLLPIPPLDGSKIIAWKPSVWQMLIAVAGMEFIVKYFLVLGWA